MNFTQDELVNAIRDASNAEGDTPNSITGPELQVALGLGKNAARTLLRDAIKAGVLEPAKVYRVPILTGVRTRVNGYVLVEEPPTNAVGGAPGE